MPEFTSVVGSSTTVAPDGVLELSTRKATEVEQPRVPFFRIDGETFTRPKDVPPVVLVRMLDTLRTRGQEAAVAEAFHYIIGERGMKQLGKVETLTEEQLKEIMGIVQSMTGALFDKLAGN